MRLRTLCVAMASWSAIGQQCTVSNNTFISVTNCTGDVCSVSPLEMSQLPHLPAFTEQLISGAAGRCNGTVVFGQPLSIRYSDISYVGSLEVRRATELFVSWVNQERRPHDGRPTAHGALPRRWRWFEPNSSDERDVPRLRDGRVSSLLAGPDGPCFFARALRGVESIDGLFQRCRTSSTTELMSGASPITM